MKVFYAALAGLYLVWAMDCACQGLYFFWSASQATAPSPPLVSLPGLPAIFWLSWLGLRILPGVPLGVITNAAWQRWRQSEWKEAIQLCRCIGLVSITLFGSLAVFNFWLYYESVCLEMHSALFSGNSYSFLGCGLLYWFCGNAPLIWGVFLLLASFVMPKHYAHARRLNPCNPSSLRN